MQRRRDRAGVAVAALPAGVAAVVVDALTPPLTSLASQGLPGACRAVRLRCTSCRLASSATLTLSLPWRTALVEWQLAYQTPRGGVLEAAAGAPSSVASVLVAPASPQLSACADGLPGTPLPTSTLVSLSVTPALLVSSARGGSNSSGYAASFLGAEADPTAPPTCAVFNDTRVSLKVLLSVSPVVFLQVSLPPSPLS